MRFRAAFSAAETDQPVSPLLVRYSSGVSPAAFLNCAVKQLWEPKPSRWRMLCTGSSELKSASFARSMRRAPAVVRAGADGCVKVSAADGRLKGEAVIAVSEASAGSKTP